MISLEVMSENFKGTYSSARCIIDSTEHFYQRPSSLTVQPNVPFIPAKSTILEYVLTWLVTFICNLWLESISDKEIVCWIYLLNEALLKKIIALWQIETF